MHEGKMRAYCWQGEAQMQGIHDGQSPVVTLVRPELAPVNTRPYTKYNVPGQISTKRSSGGILKTRTVPEQYIGKCHTLAVGKVWTSLCSSQAPPCYDDEEQVCNDEATPRKDRPYIAVSTAR